MEGPDITGGFKFSIGRPGLLRPEDGTTKAKGRPGLLRPEDGAAKAKRRSGLLRPEDGTTKAKGRSSLPVLGYVPRLCPKSAICPTSPRLRRVCSLSSALVTEELYVQAGAEAEAFSFADFDKPRRA